MITRSPRSCAARRNARKSRSVAVGRMDRAVVGGVVAVVAQRRRVERQQPDRRDAEVVDVVEPRDQPAEVADAVAVRVLERADVHLVDQGVLVPVGLASAARRRERSARADGARGSGVTGSSRSRARCAPGGARGRCARARRTGRARRSCARRARRSVAPPSRSCTWNGRPGSMPELGERQVEPRRTACCDRIER